MRSKRKSRRCFVAVAACVFLLLEAMLARAIAIDPKWDFEFLPWAKVSAIALIFSYGATFIMYATARMMALALRNMKSDEDTTRNH